METLKASLGGKGLSVTLPSSYWYLQHFDIVHLEKHVDWFNVSLRNCALSTVRSLIDVYSRSCFMTSTERGT